MEQSILTKRLIVLSAVMSALAGIIHIWLAPIHWYHAPAHGLFFLVIGVAQILWGNLVWRQPTTRLYYVGAIMSGWLIVLYAITRWLPAPFGHGPEGIDLLGISCKLCEGLAMVPPMIIIFQGLILNAGRKVAWQTIALIVLFSFAAGFSTYTVARAAEPYLPGLSAPTAEHQHDENAPAEEHHHDESTPSP